jgi:hypothetical protein
MPTLRSQRMSNEAVVAAFQYQQKIYELRKQGRLEEAEIMKKARANKIEMAIVFSGVNSSIFN